MTTSQGRVAGILALAWVEWDSARGPNGWGGWAWTGSGGGTLRALRNSKVWTGISSWGGGFSDGTWARGLAWKGISLEEFTLDLWWLQSGIQGFWDLFLTACPSLWTKISLTPG